MCKGLFFLQIKKIECFLKSFFWELDIIGREREGTQRKGKELPNNPTEIPNKRTIEVETISKIRRCPALTSRNGLIKLIIRLSQALYSTRTVPEITSELCLLSM